MLEPEIVERQRDADAADEGGVVLADEDHARRSGMGARRWHGGGARVKRAPVRDRGASTPTLPLPLKGEGRRAGAYGTNTEK
jgi:hypothetical protein